MTNSSKRSALFFFRILTQGRKLAPALLTAMCLSFPIGASAETVNVNGMNDSSNYNDVDIVDTLGKANYYHKGTISGTSSLTVTAPQNHSDYRQWLQGTYTFTGPINVNSGQLLVQNGKLQSKSINLNGGDMYVMYSDCLPHDAVVNVGAGTMLDVESGGTNIVGATINVASGGSFRMAGSSINNANEPITLNIAGTGRPSSVSGRHNAQGAIVGYHGNADLFLHANINLTDDATIFLNNMSTGRQFILRGTLTGSSTLTIASDNAGRWITFQGGDTKMDLSAFSGNFVVDCVKGRFWSDSLGTGSNITVQNSGTAFFNNTAAMENYTGSFTINNGTIELQAAGKLNNLSGNGTVTIGDNATKLNNTEDTTFAGVISGSGAITKIGSGTLTLSGANANTGAVTISEGNIKLANSSTTGTGTTTVAAGTTLEIATTEGSSQTWSGGIINGDGTLKVTGGGAFTIPMEKMQISTSGKIVADGSDITMNTLNGTFAGKNIDINNGGSFNLSGGGNIWLSNQAIITFDENGGGTFSTGFRTDGVTNVVNNSATTFTTNGGATNYIVGTNGFNLHNNSLTFNVAKGTSEDGIDLEVSTYLWNTRGHGFFKNGKGTMLMTGTPEYVNSYNGGTIINEGKLIISGSATMGESSVAVNANGTLEFAYDADKSLGNSISGSGKIVKTGDNKVTFTGPNTFTGNLDIQGGTLSTLINGTNKNFNIAKLSGSGILELRLASGSSDAKLPNLVNDNFTGVISLVQEGSASSTKINTGGNTFEGFTFKLNPGTTIFVTNELKADVLLAGGNGNSENRGSMRIANPVSGNLTLLDNSNIAFDSLQTVSGDISSGAASGQAVTLFINGKTDGTTLTNSRSNGAYTGDVSDGSTGSSLGITVCSQTQTFSGNLSYTGATTINSGAAITLTGDGANLAASRAAVVNGTLNFNNYSGEADMQLNNLSGSGAINGTDKNLVLNNTNNTTYTGTINIGTGALTKDGEGKLTLQGEAGAITAGAYAINEGVLSIDIPGGIGTPNSIVIEEPGTLSINFGPNNKSFNAQNLSGSGVLEALISQGTGNLQLTNLTTSDFTGYVSLVNNGATDSSKLYSNGQSFENATIIINPGTTLYFEHGELKADVFVAGNGNSENRGALRIRNIMSGNLTLMDDASIAFDTVQTVSGNIASAAASGQEATLFINGKTDGTTITNSRNSATFSGDISDGTTGSNLGIRVCSQTQTFSGDLSYTGATTVNSGAAMILTGDGANLVNSSAAIVNGTLDFSGYTGEDAMTLNNLTGTNGTITGGNNDLILNIAEDSFYSGKINIGTGTLTKKGEGNLKLLGANDGDLVAGTLNVDEGRLDVKEYFTGNISVKSAGILSPGNSIGTLRDTGDIALDGGTLLMEIAGPTAADSDQLFVTGNLSLTDRSTILLQFTDGYSLAPNASFEVILDAANSESVIDSVLGSIDSYYFSGLSYGLNADGFWAISGHVDPNAVPEPSTWALLILGALGLFFTRKFKTRQ